jgi:hypothetical protein
MKKLLRIIILAAVGAHMTGIDLSAAAMRPFEDGRFKGRIAYSADGNHNDPDDWAASPVALAILATAALGDRLVHFDYNSILPLTNPEWEAIHAESVLGAAQRYGYDLSRFFDDRRNLDGSIASIVAAINASSAEDPLYFIIAGPMEVPLRAIQKSDRSRLQYVYCISHSRWNDGYQTGYEFSFTKRSVIEAGVQWVQIQDQNRLLSYGRYGSPAKPAEFAPYFWMRDSNDPRVRFLWERMIVSTRPDPSDAGMVWFLITGDEQCTPAKLESLLEERRLPARGIFRPSIRLEAENFRHLEGFVLEDRNDRSASHRLNVTMDAAPAARINTRFSELFARPSARYDVEIRYMDGPGVAGRFIFLVNGAACAAWKSNGGGEGWTSHTVRDVEINAGDDLRLDVEGAQVRIDFVQLDSIDATLTGWPNPSRGDGVASLRGEEGRIQEAGAGLPVAHEPEVARAP